MATLFHVNRHVVKQHREFKMNKDRIIRLAMDFAMFMVALFMGVLIGLNMNKIKVDTAERNLEEFHKSMRSSAQPYCIANGDELDMGGTARVIKAVTQKSILDEIEVVSVMVDEESVITLKGMKFERKECGWMVVSGINVVWAEKADLIHRFKK